jgi:hypothetical protein
MYITNLWTFSFGEDFFNVRKKLQPVSNRENFIFWGERRPVAHVCSFINSIH